MAIAQTIVYLDEVSSRLSGGAVALFRLVRAIDKSRFRPVVLCPEGDLAEEYRRIGVDVVPFALPRLARVSTRGSGVLPLNPFALAVNLKRLAVPAIRLARLVRRLGAGIVHANSFTAHMVAAAARPLTQSAQVWHLQNYVEPQSAFFRLAARRVPSVLIFISNAVRDSYLRSSPAPACERLLPDGVDTDEFAPGDRAQARERVGLHPAGPLVGMVGRPVAWKGFRHFLYAAGKIRGKLLGSHFLLVGGPLAGSWERDETAEIEGLARSLGLQDCLTWLRKRDDMPDVLRSMDVLVSASPNEPLGLAVIEAMACGVPVVASLAGGPAEILAQGGGILVEPGNENQIAEAVCRILGDPRLKERLSDEARRTACERYDVRNHARTLEQLYDRFTP